MDKTSQIRNQRARDLRILAGALARSSISCVTDQLQSAAAECQAGEQHEDGYWGYDLSGLVFYEPEIQRNIRPSGALATDVVLNVKLSGKCVEEDFDGDPFEELGIEVIVNGESEVNSELVAAWYLDRAAPDDTEEGDFVHPNYHFQFGGNRIKKVDCGALIMLKSPRLAHPPMDTVLAVDWILSNYFPSHWPELREDDQYRGVVQRAQQQYWKSYATATTVGWKSNPQADSWHVQQAWPQVLS